MFEYAVQRRTRSVRSSTGAIATGFRRVVMTTSVKSTNERHVWASTPHTHKRIRPEPESDSFCEATTNVLHRQVMFVLHIVHPLPHAHILVGVAVPVQYIPPPATVRVSVVASARHRPHLHRGESAVGTVVEGDALGNCERESVYRTVHVRRELAVSALLLALAGLSRAQQIANA